MNQIDLNVKTVDIGSFIYLAAHLSKYKLDIKRALSVKIVIGDPNSISLFVYVLSVSGKLAVKLTCLIKITCEMV